MRTVFRRISALVLLLLMFTQSSLAAFMQIKDPIEFSDVPFSHWAHYYIGSVSRAPTAAQVVSMQATRARGGGATAAATTRNPACIFTTLNNSK